MKYNLLNIIGDIHFKADRSLAESARVLGGTFVKNPGETFDEFPSFSAARVGSAKQPSVMNDDSKDFGYWSWMATLSMPDTPENQARLFSLVAQAEGLGFPMMRAIALTPN